MNDRTLKLLGDALDKIADRVPDGYGYAFIVVDDEGHAMCLTNVSQEDLRGIIDDAAATHPEADPTGAVS